MRQGASGRRTRGRSGGRKHVPLKMQNFDSNGPDVRVRGNASQVYEKYLALARDANAAGDRVIAESYYQHAEHYYRIVNENTDPQPLDRNRGDQVAADGQPGPEPRSQAESGQSDADQERGQRASRQERRERHEQAERGQRRSAVAEGGDDEADVRDEGPGKAKGPCRPDGYGRLEETRTESLDVADAAPQSTSTDVRQPDSQQPGSGDGLAGDGAAQPEEKPKRPRGRPRKVAADGGNGRTRKAAASKAGAVPKGDMQGSGDAAAGSPANGAADGEGESGSQPNGAAADDNDGQPNV